MIAYVNRLLGARFLPDLHTTHNRADERACTYVVDNEQENDFDGEAANPWGLNRKCPPWVQCIEEQKREDVPQKDCESASAWISLQLGPREGRPRTHVGTLPHAAHRGRSCQHHRATRPPNERNRLATVVYMATCSDIITACCMTWCDVMREEWSQCEKMWDGSIYF
jgi:hypothetical protein